MEESRNEVFIELRFYRHAIRDLVSDPKSGKYLFDHDIDKLVLSNNETHVSTIDSSSLPNVLTRRCHITVYLIPGESTVKIVNHLQDNKFFMSTLSKYLRPIPQEFEIYLREEPVKRQKPPKTLKPLALSGQPVFFSRRRAESVSSTKEQTLAALSKQLSDPSLPLSDFGDETNYCFISNVMRNYTHKPLLRVLYNQLLVLHAMNDNIIYRFVDSNIDKKELSEQEVKLLKMAKEYHKANQGALKSKRSSGSSPKAHSLSRTSSRELIFSVSSHSSSTESPFQSRSPSPLSHSLSTELSKARRTSGDSDITQKRIELSKKITDSSLDYVIQHAIENPDFLLQVFDSFNLNKIMAAKLFNSGSLNRLMLPNNKMLGDNILKIMAGCFVLDEYNPKTDSEEFSIWFNLLINYISTYSCVPEFDRTTLPSKFLLTMSADNINVFLETVIQHSLSKELCKKILSDLSDKEGYRLARILIRKRFEPLLLLAFEENRIHCLYSLLLAKNKAVDMALLAKPEFIELIVRNSLDSLAGQILYEQLLERVKTYFDYNNLPIDGENGSDARQTQSGSGMLQQTKARLGASLAYKFLSESEIVSIYLGRVVPIGKLDHGEKWKEIYLENLSLLLSEFIPHLPNHINEIVELHSRYYDQTIGKTASTDSDRYDPRLHNLTHFPKSISQYLEKSVEKLSRFESNLNEMDKVYQVIKGYTNGTIRMSQDAQSGFTPATRVADKVLEILKQNGKTTQFTRLTLGRLISVLIVEYCKQTFEGSKSDGVCTGETLDNIIKEERSILWLKIELSEQLLSKFDYTICKSQKTDFDETPALAVIDDFCRMNIQNQHKALAIVRRISTGQELVKGRK